MDGLVVWPDVVGSRGPDVNTDGPDVAACESDSEV